MTFQEILSSLYMAVGRPAEDIADIAKLSVNLACEELHRTEDLVYSYSGAMFLCEAGIPSVALSDIEVIGGHSVLSIHHVEALGTEPRAIIRLVDFFAFQEIRRKEQALSLSEPTNLGILPKWALVTGTSLSLFPLPTTDIALGLIIKIILPKLVNDSDTNYLLTYLPGVVIAKALVYLALQLKDPELYELYSKDAERVLTSASAWNESLRKDKLETN